MICYHETTHYQKKIKQERDLEKLRVVEFVYIEDSWLDQFSIKLLHNFWKELHITFAVKVLFTIFQCYMLQFHEEGIPKILTYILKKWTVKHIKLHLLHFKPVLPSLFFQCLRSSSTTVADWRKTLK